MLVVWLAGGALVVGALLGGLAAFAALRRGVAEDVLVDVIDAELPQLQCAECGYPGCRPFARALARGEAGVDLCLPGGDDVIRRLVAIVNEPPPSAPDDSQQIQNPARENSAANIKAASGRNGWIPAFAGMTGNVAGMTDNNGEKAKHSGVDVAFIRAEECVGCALCLPVCPTDAIVGAARLAHAVLEKDCTGCALCLPVCPTDAIVMRPPKKRTALNYTLAAFRAAAKTQQDAGQQCIRCNLCAEVCPAGLAPMNLYALSMDDELVKMTKGGVEQCIHCRQCDDICPSAIPLSAAFARAKNKTAKTARAKAEAARLKARYEERQKRQTPPPPPTINPAAQAAAAKARVHR